MTTTIGLRLEPLDVLFFRDGRPFGAATRGQSELPFPQTLAGAICTALLDVHGCDFRKLTQQVCERRASFVEAVRVAGGDPRIAAIQVRGPWLAKQETTDGKLEVLVPVPAVLHTGKGGLRADDDRLRQLHPLPADRLPGWEPPESTPRLWPLWLRHPQPTEPATGFLTRAGLEAFLRAEPVRHGQVIRPAELFEFDRRTGIGINPDRLCAEESLIYGASFLAFNPKVSLYAELILPDDMGRAAFRGIDTLAFGGEGRRVRVQLLDDSYAWPEQTPTGRRQQPLVLLTTPGIFRARWKPAALNGRLVAAAVPGAVAVSGWDLARGGPKPNRFAAQAGSTYFLDQPLNPWPETLSDSAFDQQQGWGCYLKGVWTDE